MIETFKKQSPLLPNSEELSSLVGSSVHPLQLELLQKALLLPIHEFLSAGGKKLRVEIIELGFLTAGGQLDEPQKMRLEVCSQIIEGLHAGSMIIDDIQDQSEVRRGQPTLHRRYGLAIALNAGNWLYFQAVHQIQELQLRPTQETQLKHYVNEIILKAHLGQALDVGTPMSSIPQKDVRPTCLTAMELKTGALMSLAFDLGAFVADQRPLPSDLGTRFGKQFGIALQMFDDIGNFLMGPPKGKEDLRNQRPSFIWAMASGVSSEKEYDAFLQAAQSLPDPQPIESWAERLNLIAQAKAEASATLWQILEEIRVSSDLEERIRELFQKLESSYV